MIHQQHDALSMKLSERSQSKWLHTLCFHFVLFWKKQNDNDKNQMSDLQGLSVGGTFLTTQVNKITF